MAKLTVSEIKKQIAVLEAKAARLAEQETKAAVGKVRALMNQLGVTLEHLSATVGRKGAAAKKAIEGSKPKTSRRVGKGIVKYRDPQTGATWTGFGRAPAWIAGVPDRDVFRVSRGAQHAHEVGAGLPAAKKSASAGKATRKTVAKKAVGKRASAKKAAAKKSTKTPVKRTATKETAPKAATHAKRKSSGKAGIKKTAKKRLAPADAAAALAIVDSAPTSGS